MFIVHSYIVDLDQKKDSGIWSNMHAEIAQNQFSRVVLQDAWNWKIWEKFHFRFSWRSNPGTYISPISVASSSLLLKKGVASLRDKMMDYENFAMDDMEYISNDAVQELEENDVWSVITAYFEEKGLVRQQLDSFDEFLR